MERIHPELCIQGDPRTQLETCFLSGPNVSPRNFAKLGSRSYQLSHCRVLAHLATNVGMGSHFNWRESFWENTHLMSPDLGSLESHTESQSRRNACLYACTTISSSRGCRCGRKGEAPPFKLKGTNTSGSVGKPRAKPPISGRGLWHPSFLSSVSCVRVSFKASQRTSIHSAILHTLMYIIVTTSVLQLDARMTFLI